jgi:hypothetical protein
MVVSGSLLVAGCAAKGFIREPVQASETRTVRSAFYQWRLGERASYAGVPAVPAPVGWASLDTYRDHSVRLRSRFATIESFGVEPIDPQVVDELLLDVAHLLGVKLDPAKPKVRILVTRPSRIAALYGGHAAAAAMPGHVEAVGLYFPQASLVLVPRFDRALLGHELAHYVTHHYLPDAPRSTWEWLAGQVENRIVAYQRPAPGPTKVARGQRRDAG